MYRERRREGEYFGTFASVLDTFFTSAVATAKNTRTDVQCLISILYLFIMKHSYVYILKCADNSYYTGVTVNLKKRMFGHKTAKHLIVILQKDCQ